MIISPVKDKEKVVGIPNPPPNSVIRILSIFIIGNVSSKGTGSSS
ncbi:uncharacterized protein METZ01_LOCUS91769 [marine metagenome]|uniref:Uncharacterized protein n=1 Tax=marine metagenome TaxID=408172 RepID=A0A381VEY2_9ZZZZ